eukprot:3690566-Amphidinium_carterae.1
MVKSAARSPHAQCSDDKELAIDLALRRYMLAEVIHIPRVSNIVPDALSRLYPPVPKAIPAMLARAVRRHAPARDASFWSSRSLKGSWCDRLLELRHLKHDVGLRISQTRA